MVFCYNSLNFSFLGGGREGDNMALHSSELTQGFSLCLAEWDSKQCHIGAQVLSHKAVRYVAFRTRGRHQLPKPPLSSALSFSIHEKPFQAPLLCLPSGPQALLIELKTPSYQYSGELF